MDENILNKYRPQTLAQIKGNGNVLKAVRKMLASNTKSHAFLLTGDSGCGKTTLARILAKEFDCGTIIELNCADKSKREDVRDIIDRIKAKPLDGKNLCLILDEASQLSEAAQNTLLKVVEDAPSHVYFIFSSTGIGKIIPTLKNRLIKYNMAPLEQDEIYSLLLHLWDLEGYPKDEEGKYLKIIRGIARKSRGVSREAITLFAKMQTTDIEEARELIDDYEEYPEAANIIELAKMLLVLPKGDITWGDLALKQKEILANTSPETIRIVTANYLKGCLYKATDIKDEMHISKMLIAMLKPLDQYLGEASLLVNLYTAYALVAYES